LYHNKNNKKVRGKQLMEIKKGNEHFFEYYEEQSKENEKAKQAFDLAVGYANKVEELVEADKNLKLDEAFEDACTKLCVTESVSGCIKSAAFTILAKTWVHGESFMNYNVEKERVAYDELGK
jgi:hypothetical protein